MWRHAERVLGGHAIGATCLALIAPLAGAQTIADYSRAQRAFLENAMTQAAARSAGTGASTPATAASAPAAAVPAAAPARPALPAPSPVVQVSGVFASSRSALAEVVVDSTPYLLAAGERVPGTSWQVRTVAVDRVVLARHGVGVDDAEGGLRFFPLPALR